jgi:tetratricopeptide (TPR) repeat protein
VAPEVQDLIGAAKANESLAHISLTFVQSLGEAGSTNETYQASLADLYRKMSDALGGIYHHNALGDYETALRFENQFLAISRNLLSKHPTDKERQRLVSVGERGVGTLLQVSGDYDEALVHMQRHVAISEEILKANPTDATAIRGLPRAHLHYANLLSDQGRNKEALEQYYRYGKEWLEHPVPTSADPEDLETMYSYVAQASVGDIYLKLGQPSKALPLYEQALQWIKLFSERQPNNARWPRDWSELHGDLGTTQIALGRFDEGMTNLQLAVELAESLVARDPANGLSQQMLAELLQQEGEGWMKVTGSPGISRERQAEDWQRAIMAVTRCQEKLDSPQLAHQPKSQLIKKRSEIESELNEARNGYAKIAGETKTNSSTK